MALANITPFRRYLGGGCWAFLWTVLWTSVPVELKAYVAIIAGIGAAVAFWPIIPHFDAWLRSRLESPLNWFAWVLIVAGLGGAGYGVLELVERYTYNFGYQLCRVHMWRKGQNGPEVASYQAVIRLLNEGHSNVFVRIQKADFNLGGQTSHLHLAGQEITVPRHAKNYVIADLVEFPAGTRPLPMTGEIRYVIRYGRENEEPTHRMIVSGTLNVVYSNDALFDGTGFQKDPDSAQPMIADICTLTRQANNGIEAKSR